MQWKARQTIETFVDDGRVGQSDVVSPCNVWEFQVGFIESISAGCSIGKAAGAWALSALPIVTSTTIKILSSGAYCPPFLLHLSVSTYFPFG